MYDIIKIFCVLTAVFPWANYCLEGLWIKFCSKSLTWALLNDFSYPYFFWKGTMCFSNNILWPMRKCLSILPSTLIFISELQIIRVVVPRTNIVGKVPKPRIWASFCTSGIVTIAGFHMMSLKFKLQNYRRYQDFNFMMYWSSWKLIFIPIFASKGFLVLW